MHLNRESRKMLFNGRKLAGNGQTDRRFMFTKKIWPQGVVCPSSGAIYMYMIFKHLLLCNHVANQCQTLYGASLGSGNKNLYKWSNSHNQDSHRGYK